jgi:hypothetical protein
VGRTGVVWRKSSFENRLDRNLVCGRLPCNLALISITENLYQTGLVFKTRRAEVTRVYRRGGKAPVSCI